MDYLLWELSFQNLNMLLATIPSYESEEEKEKEKKGQPEDHDGFGALRDFIKD